MSYPEYVEVDGQQYKLDTSFKTALRCFEVIEDPNIDDYERCYAVIYLLLDDIPQCDLSKLMSVLKKYLQCGKEQKQINTDKPDMDLIFDQKYIQASFMSDYHIDTSVEDMHYWKYMTLVEGLTETCILNKVRELRTTEVKDYKGKARARLEKAKKAVALPQKVTRDDMEAMAKFDALFQSNELDEDDELLEEVE